jgi:ATP-dependent DNA ligase
MRLPLRTSYPPMEAEPASELPAGPQWQYEPKWDGFRCLAFRDGPKIDLQSKSQKPLTRYFPELVAALAAIKAKKIVLDGEIVVPVEGSLSFSDLLMRIRPAASRIQKLSKENLVCISFSICWSMKMATAWSISRWTSGVPS